jgi:membrane associated rhomboid family serine protease
MNYYYRLVKNRFPVISLLLALSCFISTLPQFFLSAVYSTLTAQFPAVSHLYLATLPSFTHSPDFLLVHLIGNVLVILVFGSIAEIVLGRNRFAFLTLLTFFGSTLVAYLRMNGTAGTIHGASGICFGYHSLFLFVLVILVERKRWDILKKPGTILLLVFAVFNVFGIPVVEVVVYNAGFFRNFGQTLHLLSYLVILVPVLIWRKEIEDAVIRILNREDIQENVRKKNRVSQALIFFVLALNLINTVIIIRESTENTFAYSVIPAEGTPIDRIGTEVCVHFSHPVEENSEYLIRKSISYDDDKRTPEVKVEWPGDRQMKLRFSRPFTKSESLLLIYTIQRYTSQGYKLEEKTAIQFK